MSFYLLIDVGAYSLPIITSIYGLIIEHPPLQLTAISILLVNFKFLLFFRVFQSYGKYFAIIIGVAKEVFPFLVILFFIILGFGSAFYILLGTTNPINPIKSSDSNTNMFSWLPTSFLAMYLFLTGNNLNNYLT